MVRALEALTRTAFLFRDAFRFMVFVIRVEGLGFNYRGLDSCFRVFRLLMVFVVMLLYFVLRAGFSVEGEGWLGFRVYDCDNGLGFRVWGWGSDFVCRAFGGLGLSSVG